MRHLLPAAVLLAGAFAVPAYAAEEVTPEQVEAATAAVEAAELSDEAYLNMWCGAAFGVVKEMMTAQGNTADAASMDASQAVVFSKAAAELIEAGVSKEDFEALATSFYYVVVSQNKESGGEADYTQEDCEAAAQP